MVDGNVTISARPPPVKIQPWAIETLQTDVSVHDILCNVDDMCVCRWKHRDEPENFWVMLLSNDLDSLIQSIYSYFAAYFIGITFLYIMMQNKSTVLRLLYWTYDQYPSLQKWHRTNQWGDLIATTTVRLKAQPVCILVNTDEVCDVLFLMVMNEAQEHADQSVVSNGRLRTQ